jgi:acyl carrier protein/2-polyprenyl-3-methyl-5-hydroxy-6-metoxy-1,4-benzoquinol methylase
MLHADGIAVVDNEQIIFAADAAAIPASSEILHRAVVRFPELQNTFNFLNHCASHYRHVMNGQVEGISVLYPEGSARMMEAATHPIDQRGDYSLYLRLLTDTVAKIARSGNRPIRILEIGGGRGLLTKVLLPTLRALDISYTFTDIGRSFVMEMQEWTTKSGYDFVTCAPLDISKPGVEQGFAAETFDLVIGFDVVHATNHIAQTCASLEALLSPGGTLLLLESTNPRRWMTMVWGLSKDWWSFTDTELRTSGPLISPVQWTSVLNRIGFEDICAFPESDSRQQVTRACLLYGKKSHSVVGVETNSPAGAGEILRLTADVSDEAGMAQAIAHVKERFGRIDGVFHTAGVPGGMLLNRIDAEAANEVFRAKVTGTIILEKLLRPAPPDFMVLFSSITAYAASVGQADYAGANAFLDAFAQRIATDGRFRVLSVNWDRWQHIGLARQVESRHRQLAGDALAGGIAATDAVSALFQVLAETTLPQVVIAGSAPSMLQQRARRINVDEIKKLRPSAELYQRPQLATPYIPPSNDLEARVVEIFSATLRIEDIGRDDSFVELGGDSLTAIKVISRIRESLQVEFNVRWLFEDQTAASVARRIGSQQQTAEVLVGVMDEGEI